AVTRLQRMADGEERCLSDLDLPAGFRSRFLASLKKVPDTQFADGLINAARQGSKYTFLRVRTRNGRPSVLMRLITPDPELNYQEITLARFPDGEIAAEDIYSVAAGETMSQTMRRLILMQAAELDPGMMAKVGRTEQLYVK